MSANDSQHRQGFSKVQTSLLPFEGVCARQSKEIACDGIIDTEAQVVEVARASCLGCDIVALLNEANRVRKEVFTLRSLEM